MAYEDLLNIQTLDVGDILTAACMTQARDNDEFLIDPPACSVYHSTTQSQASGTTLVGLSANSENYDNASMHSTSSLTSRIVVPLDGRWEIGTVVAWAADGAGNRAVAFRVNGTDDYVVDIRGGTSTNSTVQNGSRTLVLTAGDRVEVFVWQTSGSPLDCTLDEFYCLFRTR